ncbi:hypothetical protein VTI28DRAFT_9682 [Corynascus sepedonium]
MLTTSSWILHLRPGPIFRCLFTKSRTHLLRARKLPTQSLWADTLTYGSPLVPGWATFDIYLPGLEDDKLTLIKFTRTAWVVDSLGPNLLLGNEFLDEYNANIDYQDKEVHFKRLNFCVPFSVYRHSVPCVRKVKTTREITLLPDQDAMVPVEYKPLPTGRSFMFNSRHEAVYNAVVDAKTPKVVSVRNTTRGTIRIPKRHPVGQIEEVEDSGYFACSWDTAFAALTMGTAQTARSVAAADAGVDTAFLVGQQVDVVPVNAEFDLNSKARAILDRGSTTAMGAEKPAVPEVQLAQATSPADFDSTLSDTPMIDHVFQLTQTVNTGLQTNMEEDNRRSPHLRS